MGLLTAPYRMVPHTFLKPTEAGKPQMPSNCSKSGEGLFALFPVARRTSLLGSEQERLLHYAIRVTGEAPLSGQINWNLSRNLPISLSWTVPSLSYPWGFTANMFIYPANILWAPALGQQGVESLVSIQIPHKASSLGVQPITVQRWQWRARVESGSDKLLPRYK